MRFISKARKIFNIIESIKKKVSITCVRQDEKGNLLYDSEISLYIISSVPLETNAVKASGKISQFIKSIFSRKDGNEKINYLLQATPYLIIDDAQLSFFLPRYSGEAVMVRLSFIYGVKEHYFSTQLMKIEMEKGSPLFILKNPEEIYVHERRGHFRAEVTNNEVEVRIGGREFILEDISINGLGIILNSSTVFSIGQTLRSIAISLPGKGDKIFVDGIVRHISPREGNKFLAGIQFRFKNEKELREIRGNITSRYASKKQIEDYQKKIERDE
jgi:Tfp pilus assembly protein PilZ